MLEVFPIFERKKYTGEYVTDSWMYEQVLVVGESNVVLMATI